MIVSDPQRRRVAALCYIAWQTQGGKPASDYLERMIAMALKFGFPRWYVNRIRSFGR